MPRLQLERAEHRNGSRDGEAAPNQAAAESRPMCAEATPAPIAGIEIEA
ncbi:MAG TPA: hypothetical protein VFW18_02705 [Gaiellales bacterium]|nr:hypothetical protein [Gaiellales bacterium]